MNKPKIHILIVEDDLIDRMACRRALAQNPGYEFVLSEAETGSAGLQLAHAQKMDCVLLDYNLPDMNGLEFLVALKSDMGEITVPVIMLTGANNASVAVEAMKRGAQDYLVKDVNRQYLELLPTVIQHLLRERQALTEKVQMESRLAQAETKYRFLVEQIPAITYTAALDAPGKLLYVSPQLRTLGYSPEEWISNVGAILSYIHPDDRALAMEAFDKVRDTGKPLRYEYRLLNHDGDVRWVLDEASLVPDESGHPLLLQGILIDITKDKLVEEELSLHRRRMEDLVNMRTTQFKKQASVLDSANTNLASKLDACIQAEIVLKKYANQLADLYNNAPCSYYSLDSDGMFIQINDTGLEWLGHTREEVVGKMKLTDLLLSASEKIFLENYQRFKKCGWIRDLELDLMRKDGTTLTVLLYANAVTDAGGHFVMSRTMMFDITDRKRPEQAL